MTTSITWAIEARDRIHNLDLSLPSHQKIYDNMAQEFIMRNEIFYTDAESFKRYLKTGEEPKNQPFETRKIENFYIWRSIYDNKVRLTHKANDGKIFSLRNPPGSGNPGEDYGCRCYIEDEIPIWVELSSD